ncbi:ABC transporter permease [Paucibacter sp. B2R-40]|uniref:ABC transporter permease n=1 Tax=Paucibacter sp. B2R-40 TaxID=2893554 RepID=UPI0021E50AAB|nr:ABC transporter permease [Paucibacter sp. B2R-40]MCV2355505.1 ABC transporter permease [Paucibacter sp. B2R-40]
MSKILSSKPLGALFLLISLLGLSAGSACAQSSEKLCGDLANAYGPFDYRRYHGSGDIVTGAHFTPTVESLKSGKTSNTAGGDIDYTLRAIPNYHRALIAVIRLGEKEKTDQPRGMRYTVECWLERAARFQPDDTVVRMIFATYLVKKQRKAEARQQLDAVKNLAQDNALTHYNLGMVYADMEDYEEALDQAHQAIELGYDSPGLRDRLKAVGKWREPVKTEIEDLSPVVENAAPRASPK